MDLVKRPLTFKLILFQLIISIIFVFIASVIQYQTSLKDGYKGINESFELFENSYLEPIVVSIYYVDETLLDIQLLGALKIGHIDYIRVNEDLLQEVKVKEVGIKEDAEYLKKNLPLDYVDSQDNNYNFGNIELYANLTTMKRSALEDSFKNLVTIFGLILVLSISLFIMLNALFISHIHTIVSYTKGLNYTDGDIDLDLRRSRLASNANDELSYLVNGINSMKNKIFSDFKKIKEIEKELNILNKNLEYKVVEKSNKLEEAVDALRETQKKLVESEKLSALRGLVAGITHEINNPLGVSITAISFVKDLATDVNKKYINSTLKKSDLEEYINQNNELSQSIMNNLKRASDLVTNLKNIARDQSTEEKRIFNLGDYIEDILVTLRIKLKRTRHQIFIDCPGDISINSIPGAFGQILTNLVLNSLIHGFENIEEGRIDISVSKEDSNIVIIYKDNGKGVEEEIKKKIFDPFFTTKVGQGGSGLGLQVVHNIVTETLHGCLEFESSLNNGVEFKFIIPV